MNALLPAGVRAALEATVAGHAWLDEPDQDTRERLTVELMWREDLPDDVRGWVLTAGMFDNVRWLGKSIGRDPRLAALLPHVIDAFIAGVRGGLGAPRIWLLVEQMLADSELPLPAALADIIPIGLASKRANDRQVAARFAARLGITTPTVSKPGHPADEPLDLLRRLIVAWGITHDVRLEEPIARIGMAIAHGRGPLVARSKGELEKAWLALAADCDAGDIDRLLDTPWPAQWKPATLRLNALAKLPPDPRIATRVIETAMRYDSHGSYPLHVTVAALVSKQPTPAVLPALYEFRTYSDRARTYSKVREAVEALRPTAADPALVDEARATKPMQDVAVLFAQHVANPADLALRAVLADALQANGDPLGEFIIVQTRIADGTADAPARKRAAALLDAYADRWTASVPGIERRSRRFERGFLVAARTAASRDDLAVACSRPVWATVEELVLDNHADLRSLVSHMPLLRTLFTPWREPLALLAETGTWPSIRALGAADWMPADRGAFPNLEVLAGAWIGTTTSVERMAEVIRATAALGITGVVHVAPPIDHLRHIFRMRALGPPRTSVIVNHRVEHFDDQGLRIRVFRDRPRAEVEPSQRYDSNRATIDAAFAAAGIAEVVECPIDLTR